jgi:hypothetical protein
MIRFKSPIEFEFSPDSLERGTHWLTLRLKNAESDDLQNLNVKMHSLDSLHISFHNPNEYIFLLKSGEEKYLNFQVDAYWSSHVYISIHGSKDGEHFHWESPLIRETVFGDPAEIERIFVANPYGTLGKDLEVDAVVKGLSSSDGLGVAFWAETPSGKFEELAEMKTKKMSKGDETSYKAKIKPKEEGFYTVYVNLYDENRLIDKGYDTMWVEAA